MGTNTITFLASICILFLIGRIFILPIKLILKLVFNSILGILMLLIINLVGKMWSFHIGINFITSITIGILGVPGAVCLVIIRLLIG